MTPCHDLDPGEGRTGKENSTRLHANPVRPYVILPKLTLKTVKSGREDKWHPAAGRAGGVRFNPGSEWGPLASANDAAYGGVINENF